MLKNEKTGGNIALEYHLCYENSNSYPFKQNVFFSKDLIFEG